MDLLNAGNSKSNITNSVFHASLMMLKLHLKITAWALKMFFFSFTRQHSRLTSSSTTAALPFCVTNHIYVLSVFLRVTSTALDWFSMKCIILLIPAVKKWNYLKSWKQKEKFVNLSWRTFPRKWVGLSSGFVYFFSLQYKVI